MAAFLSKDKKIPNIEQFVVLHHLFFLTWTTATLVGPSATCLDFGLHTDLI